MYDPKHGFEYKGALRLYGAQVDSAQGGTFTDNGHLVMT